MPTALFSTYDKKGVVPFAKELHSLGWTLLASGGTAKVIADANIPVTDIADLVGEPILGHRVVTLSRQVHAGLLAQRNAQDTEELARLNIPFIDLVYINLYPLVETIADSNATMDTVIEKTDVGGPTMLHAASKGRRLIVLDNHDAQEVLIHLKSNQGMLSDSAQLAQMLARKAEKTVAAYCIASAATLTSEGSLERRLLRAAYQQLTGEELKIRFT